MALPFSSACPYVGRRKGPFTFPLLDSKCTNVKGVPKKTLVVVLFSGLVGYAVRAVTSFREYKQKADQEILSPVLTMAYKRDPREQEERAFNQAL